MFRKFITVASSLALSAMCLTGCNQTTTDKEAKKTLDKVTIAEVTHSVFMHHSMLLLLKDSLKKKVLKLI